MHLLKQSTAATVIVGPVLDSSGAAVTTAVVGDFRLAKEGTSAVLSGATVTHDANGYYLIALTATNTNTVGRLAIYSNNTAQSMGTTRFMVLLPSVYDALVTNATNATGGLPAATAQITALAGAISTFSGGAVASVTGAVGSVTAAVTVGTNNDKTGYSLTAGTGLGNQTANITGNLSGSVGSVTGSVGSVTAGVTVTTNNDKTGYSLTQAFPANFASLGINASGHVSRVTLVDTTTVNTDMRGTDGALLAASYTAPLSASETRSAIGLASANLDTQLADIPTVAEFEARTLTTANYATATNQTAIKSVTDKLNTTLVVDGLVWKYTVNALSNAPGGAGGGSATIENQELILANLNDITGAVSAAVARLQLETQITGFPATICRGSDYDTTLESEIRLQLLDLNNDPITEIGGTPVDEITWLFGLGTDRQPRLVEGACSWDDTTDELVIELAAADTNATPLGSVTWQIGAQIGELVRWLGGGTTRIIERQFTA